MLALFPKARWRDLGNERRASENEIVDAQSTYGTCVIRLHKLPHIVDEQRMLVVVKQNQNDPNYCDNKPKKGGVGKTTTCINLSAI